jgi:hypothetical protein
LVECWYTRAIAVISEENPPYALEATMASTPLSPETQAEVESLCRAIHEAVDGEIRELAANLATTDDAHLFGDNWPGCLFLVTAALSGTCQAQSPAGSPVDPEWRLVANSSLILRARMDVPVEKGDETIKTGEESFARLFNPPARSQDAICCQVSLLRSVGTSRTRAVSSTAS